MKLLVDACKYRPVVIRVRVRVQLNSDKKYNSDEVRKTLILGLLVLVVEKLVHTHTHMVLRESLDDSLRHRLPWDIDLVIHESVDEHEEELEDSGLIVVTHAYLIC